MWTIVKIFKYFVKVTCGKFYVDDDVLSIKISITAAIEKCHKNHCVGATFVLIIC